MFLPTEYGQSACQVGAAGKHLFSVFRVLSSGDRNPPSVLSEVWNDTVANLTLMALGSSAPEILLAVIELLGTGSALPWMLLLYGEVP